MGDPGSNTDDSDLPSESELEADKETLDGHVETVNGAPDKADAAVHGVEKDMNWWDKLWNGIGGFFSELNQKLQDLRNTVVDFVTKYSGSDIGNPYRLLEVGSTYYSAQSLFSGMLVKLESYNLPCLTDSVWDGVAGDTYRAGVPVQRGAIELVAARCGGMGEVAKSHARKIIDAYVNMRLDFTLAMSDFGANMLLLSTATLAEIKDVLDALIVAAKGLLDSVAVMQADVALIRNESDASLDVVEGIMANQTGTIHGEWPPFVAA